MRSFIGIDWGQKKIGTAFGNDETKIAFAAELIENDAQDKRNPKVFDHLIQLAHQHDACIFIVGISHHDGHNDNAEATKTFVAQMEQRSAIKIILVDEMLTTKQARANMQAAGKKMTAQEDDVEAARIILQQYLDSLS